MGTITAKKDETRGRWRASAYQHDSSPTRYLKPHREPGVPDWYFFWTGNHTMANRGPEPVAQRLIPAKDLP